MAEEVVSYISLRAIVPEDAWPHELLSLLSTEEGTTLLDYFAYIDSEVSVFPNGLFMRLLTRAMVDLEIPIPFLEGCSLVVGYSEAEDGGMIEVDYFEGYEYEPEREYVEEETDEGEGPPIVELRIRGSLLSLKLNRNFLKPVEIITELKDNNRKKVTGYREKEGSVNINLGGKTFTLRYDGESWSRGSGRFREEEDSGVNIPPCMIGNTGVIIEAKDIRFSLLGNDLNPENAPDDWEGIYIGQAKVYIPGVMSGSVEAEGLGIGSGGIYGRIEYESPLTYNAETQTFSGDEDENLVGEVFGMSGGISSIALEFYQNIPVKAEIKGKILLPFFDEPIDVSIGIDADGNFHVTLTNTDEDGIYMLKKENILEAKIETISFEKKEDLFVVNLSGRIRPLVFDVDWPEFEVEKLSIDSEGNVRIDGGWIDVSDKLSFNFYGFPMEVTQVGFGSDEDQDGRYRWIGFSGDIQLVKGLKAGGSVEGLRIKWWDTGKIDVDLKGVGVNFEIPGVLKFDGTVAFLRDGVEGFKGDVKLNLIHLGLEMDAALVIRKCTIGGGEFRFFYIYVNVELPAGVPLGPTGVGIYGMAGLFAYNMEPDKKPGEEWYDGWYKRGKIGATSPDKWEEKKDALALGGGTTLGTIADSGYTVSAKTLIVIVIPGPTIIMEGRASFLRRRTALSEEGPFRALAVFDRRAGHLLINIEATYKFDRDGRVVDIHGGAEAFFDYHRINNWHLYLGEKEPRSKRIRAQILKLFGAETYLMLEPTRLAWGFWCGFDEKWKFGPVRITAAAWAEGAVDLSWKPEQYYGKAWLHGGLDVKVFWFNFGFYLDTGIEVNTPHPYFTHLAFRIGIKLRWPFPDFKIRIDLKWKKEKDPPRPLPLKEVAIGHEIVQENIVLPRDTLLLPNYDDDNDEFVDDGLIDTCPSQEPETPAEKYIPVVSLDSRPILTFGKPVSDAAHVGNNSYPLESEWQKIGHCGKDRILKDYQYKFELTKILLQKERGSVWVTVAGTDGGDYPPLYGTWLPAEDGEGNPAQTKLQLWTKTPFSYTRYSTRDYEDGFIEDNPNYPCIPGYTGKTICVEFDDLPLETYRRELEHHSIKFRVPGWLSIIENSWQVEETSYQRALKIIHKLDFSPIFVIALPEEAYGVTVDLWAESSFVPPAGVVHFLEADGTVVDTQYLVDGENRIKYGRFFCLHPDMKNDTTSDNDPRNYAREKIKYLVFVVMKELCIFKICYLPVSECEKEKKYYEYRNRTQTMFAHWYHEGNILEPYTKYRLKIITNITRRENGAQTENEICEYAFFKTEGPPGFVELTKKELPKSLLFKISSNVGTIINSLNSGSISDELRAEFLENGITLSESVHVKPDEEKWSIVDTADRERVFIVEKRESTLNVYRETKHENPLDSLDLYVKDTMPKNGQHPFYRAYDMGIAFREDYVELMYKIAHHDLGIYLFDNDGQPVKDAFGRIITFSNVWGKPEEVKLTEEEEIYVWLMENSLCIDFDRNYIPPKDILDNYAKNRFLLPQKLYEARVIPMLFHETFEYESIEGWTIEDEGWTIKDEGNIERPSDWHPSKDPDNHSIRFLAQTSNIHTVISGELDLQYCRGTYIYYGEEDWADYRLTVILASGDDDAIGVMFRYQDPNNYYRFSIDRERKYRRLIKMENGIQRLAEDDWRYKKDRTYTVTIEAIKDSIAVFMDGELIFNVTDENPFLKGKIALYCWANEDARFYEVAVEDLSENAQSVYKYQFSPSQYANFFHLIHSFDDKIWPVDLPDGSNLQGEKFEEVWPDHIQLPQQVEIDLLKKENQNVGFLLKSPEPVEWPRVALDVMKSNTLAHLGMPGAVKITSFGKNSEQWVDLLIREDTPLYNWRIEYADNPEDLQWKPFYTFKGFRLFTKTEFSDEDFQLIPSVEGSYFIDGDTTWKNYRVTADFELYGNYQEAGILFRCKDEGNYYKLVISNIGGIKLLKKVDHNITILWESPHVRTDKFSKLRDEFAAKLEKGISKESELKMRYRVIVEIDGSKITILVNGEHYFEVNDSENNIDHGCVGAFFLPEAKVIFEKLSVISLEKKSFCSGQQIRVNSAEKQVSHSETMLVFDTEKSIPELIEVSSGIAFRILDENGTTIHQRTFLSKEEFADAGTFCVIPSADGTAALILPVDSNNVEENNLYRFAFTFSRKKEGLPVLKQWGQDTCELASIEFRL